MVPLLRASHFQPTVAVTAIATALALSSGRGAAALWVALAVLTGQLSVGWSNDYADRHRDRLAGRFDKPIPAGQVDADLVAKAAALALVACVPLSLLSGVRAGTVHLVAVAAALAYNAGLKATVFSVVPYAVAFGALPAFVTLGLAGAPAPPWWAVAAGALLGSGAHFVNTLPDRTADQQTGVRGLPQRLPPGVSLLAGVGLMGSAAVLAALAPDGPPPPAAVVFLLAALVVSGAVVATVMVGRHRTAWSLTLVLAGLTVSGLLVTGSRLVP